MTITVYPFLPNARSDTIVSVYRLYFWKIRWFSYWSQIS
jgi:hypothetical protein